MSSEAPRIARIDAELQRLIDAGQFAGFATEVWWRDELVHRSAIGFSDMASGAPMTPETIVRIFSMTKPVTAVAMMILHDQGRWRAQDPIAKHLPELAGLQVFEGLDEAGSPILRPPHTQPTVAQLLTHTAGFSYSFDPGWVEDRYRELDVWRATGMDDFVARVAQLPLAYHPGACWRYSISMELEGAIIERLSGLTLPDFFRSHIFDPLGMADTDFHVPHGKAGRLATLYGWQDRRLQPAINPLQDSLGAPPALASGGGGLYGTVVDYARFGRMLLNLGELDGRRIMSEAAARAMMSVQVEPAIIQGGFGIGFQQLRPGYEFGYNGVVVSDPLRAGVALGASSYLWDGLASTWFWVDPENRVVFVGMVQRIIDPDTPLLQPITQAAIHEALLSAPLGVGN